MALKDGRNRQSKAAFDRLSLMWQLRKQSVGGRLPLDKYIEADITMTAAPKSVPPGRVARSGRAANAVSTLDVASPYYYLREHGGGYE